MPNTLKQKMLIKISCLCLSLIFSMANSGSADLLTQQRQTLASKSEGEGNLRLQLENNGIPTLLRPEEMEAVLIDKSIRSTFSLHQKDTPVKADAKIDTLRTKFGRKSADLFDASNIGFPIPPGFGLSYDDLYLFLSEYEKTGEIPEEMRSLVQQYITDLEKKASKFFGYPIKFNDEKNPLLLSARSSEITYRPGQLDSILNLGATEKTKKALLKKFDSKNKVNTLYKGLKQKYKTLTKRSLPVDPLDQVLHSILAIYKNGASIESDTGVIVQAMVFGNRNQRSGSGTLQTHNANTGEVSLSVNFAENIQGTALASGSVKDEEVRNLDWLSKKFPEVSKQLVRLSQLALQEKKFPQRFEFTIENDALFILQLEEQPLHPTAKATWIRKQLDAGNISWEKAAVSLDETIQRKIYKIKEDASPEVLTKGVPGALGAGRGQLVLDLPSAIELDKQGKKIILVGLTEDLFNSIDKIATITNLMGIITPDGAYMTHLSDMATSLGIPHVKGAESIKIQKKNLKINNEEYSPGNFIGINGEQGLVFTDPGENTLEEVSVLSFAKISFDKAHLRKYLLDLYKKIPLDSGNAYLRLVKSHASLRKDQQQLNEIHTTLLRDSLNGLNEKRIKDFFRIATQVHPSLKIKFRQQIKKVPVSSWLRSLNDPNGFLKNEQKKRQLYNFILNTLPSVMAAQQLTTHWYHVWIFNQIHGFRKNGLMQAFPVVGQDKNISQEKDYLWRHGEFAFEEENLGIIIFEGLDNRTYRPEVTLLKNPMQINDLLKYLNTMGIPVKPFFVYYSENDLHQIFNAGGIQFKAQDLENVRKAMDQFYSTEMLEDTTRPKNKSLSLLPPILTQKEKASQEIVNEIHLGVPVSAVTVHSKTPFMAFATKTLKENHVSFYNINNWKKEKQLEINSSISNQTPFLHFDNSGKYMIFEEKRQEIKNEKPKKFSVEWPQRKQPLHLWNIQKLDTILPLLGLELDRIDVATFNPKEPTIFISGFKIERGKKWGQDKRYKITAYYDIKNPKKPKLLYSLKEPYLNGTKSGLFHPNGKYLATTEQKKLHIWKITAKQELLPILEWESFEGEKVFEFSPDGEILVTGNEDGLLKLIDVSWPTSPKEITIFLEHTAPIQAAVIHPNGKYLAVANGIFTMLWDITNPETPKLLKSFSEHNDTILNIFFYENGSKLISVGKDGQIVERDLKIILEDKNRSQQLNEEGTFQKAA